MNAKQYCRLLLMALLCFITIGAAAQGPLTRSLSFEVQRQRLSDVLEIIANKGSFYFSYNSNSIRRDSLVSLSVNNRTVRQVLEQLLPDHYEFRESGNYIIIRRAPIKLTLVTNKAVATDRFYLVSGYVLDDQTGSHIPNASVYEKKLLLSALTNREGYFRLKLKEKRRRVALTISKEFYEDTTVTVDPGFDQQITVTIMPVGEGPVTIVAPEDYFAPAELKLQVAGDSSVTEYTYVKRDSIKVDQVSIARLLISARQRFQSLNLKGFLATRPYQVSFVPGIGTHGRLSGQVINHFSLNVLGGYNAGVVGAEIGGLFNIDKGNVGYAQVAGLLNVVGGKVDGAQVAGIHNLVLDNFRGAQVGGVSNFVRGHFTGLQVGGVYNHVTDSVRGMQVAGVANFVRRSHHGMQVAGVANVTSHTLRGVQVASVLNYARRMNGVQIGLINIADTTNGVQLGLINISLKGYHKLAVYTDDIVPLNAAFKSGGRGLYSILFAGFNPVDEGPDVFSFGYGLGSQLRFSRVVSINPELSAQHLYLGSWDYANILGRGRLLLSLQLHKYFGIFGGPSYNVYYSRQPFDVAGYRSAAAPGGNVKTHSFDTYVRGWAGWSAGLHFF
ncbi:MAG: hypothetical protein EOO16_11885 [Chitinophagaceae bacterium]|nr:MAG: hypothetical protein EOO16_11885 [Chitinophagaceae bacterium]